MIHLVTDSTSDILPSEAQALGVNVVPLTVRFGDEQFRDGVDIDADGFYVKLERSNVQPKTSQPSPEAFATLYRTLLANPDDQVVGLHISAKLSGTLQSAQLAAQDFDTERIHLVDTQSVSGGLQLLVLAALDDIKSGADAATVAANATERRSRLSILVLLDTLTYLHRGGRIGRAQALVGGLLNVKPLIAVRDGEVVPLARVRNHSKGIDMIVDGIRERLPLGAPRSLSRGCGTDARHPPDAARLGDPGCERGPRADRTRGRRVQRAGRGGHRLHRRRLRAVAATIE